MTFTTTIKDEITKINDNHLEALVALSAYLNFNSTFTEEKLTIIMENASVTRWLFKLLKTSYDVEIILTTRTIKRFKTRNLYILEIKKKLSTIKANIDNLLKTILSCSNEEKIAFLKGLFLASGSINDPRKNLYHLEFLVKKGSDANLINELLISLDFNSKILKRDREYMIYIKASEAISDFIKYLGAMNALFYFEDIRIYKDHKNMVNRLNNCEQANMEKSLKSSESILNKIAYLEANNLLNLFDERTNEIIDYKKKYPDTSLAELAEIISLETNKTISKSGINHHCRKINELIRKHTSN